MEQGFHVPIIVGAVIRGNLLAQLPLTCHTRACPSAGVYQAAEERKKGKALSRSVWRFNCPGGLRHVIVQFE